MGAFNSILLVAACAALAACSHAGDVSRVATDFNRALADTRNEQSLLNILRASAREPLQFTAVGEVTATVNRTVGIDTVATNLITGGRDAISPTLRLGASTVPVVRMAPMANKDFAEGLLKPTTAETLSMFLGQGWDADFVLPLLVGSFQCGDEIAFNSGKPGSAGEAVRRRLSSAAENFRLRQEATPGDETHLTVPSEKALAALTGPMSGGYKVVKVGPGPDAQSSLLTIRGPGKSEWRAGSEGLCGRVGLQPFKFEASSAGASSIQLRSPEGIIYFLGEALRPCYLSGASSCAITYEKDGEPRFLFRVFAGATPLEQPAISVEMYGRRYWIPRLDAADRDRTLKTLTFLNELIALQSNPVQLAPSLISIPH